MFVENKHEMIKELKKWKDSDSSEERGEVYSAWKERGTNG